MKESQETAGDESEAMPEPGSVLVVDLGEEAARAHLFDLVEGAPRFLAVVSGPADSEVGALLEQLGQASARDLVDDGRLISPQRSNGDGVDALYLIVDGTGEGEPSSPPDLLPATAERIDREIAGRTALDFLATRMGRVLLAIDFDLDAATSSPASADDQSTYSILREAVAGIGEQLDSNGGRSRVNVIEIGPSLLAAPLGAAFLAIVDGCGLQPDSGMITLAADPEGLLLPLGAIAAVAPGFAEAVFEQDFLLPLGSYLAIEPPEGDASQLLSGTLLVGPDDEVRRFTLAKGDLARLDLERGAGASLKLELAPGARLGDFSSEEPVRIQAPGEITGGALGIILDGRTSSDLAGNPEALSGWLDVLRRE